MKNNIKVDKDLKKVLIIGANGFLGTKILQFRDKKEILNNNLFLIASDLNNHNIEQNIPFHYIDITNEEDTVNKIIDSLKIVFNQESILLAEQKTDIQFV